MNFRLSDLFFAALIIAAAYGLYTVKWEVHSLKRENARLAGSITQQREALDVLEAEWVYLNRPERLRDLAEKYLALQPEGGQQMVDIARIVEVPELLQTAESEVLINDAHLASATAITKQGF